MVECSECKKFYDCLYGGELVGRLTSCPDFQQKPKTNADRIRAMSDEELAELFHGFCDNGERCVYCPLYEKSCAGVHSDVPKWLEWLQQPAEGECP